MYKNENGFFVAALYDSLSTPNSDDMRFARAWATCVRTYWHLKDWRISQFSKFFKFVSPDYWYKLLPSQTLNFFLIFSLTRLTISLRNQFPFSGRFHHIQCKAAGPMERYLKQMGLINWGGASLNRKINTAIFVSSVSQGADYPGYTWPRLLASWFHLAKL